MLMHLEITNIAIIEKLSIDFEKGLNVLTGETGAGKSIIIDSINALLGMRTSRDLIRSGEEKASVEGVFLDSKGKTIKILEQLGIEPEPDGTLVVAREISLAGKNICRINGRLVSVSALRELGEKLIDIHGQYDSQSLLRIEMHAELLDAFGGEAVSELKDEYRYLVDKYAGLYQKIKKLSGNSNDREKMIDLLKYQIDEIEKANLYEGEEEDLKSRRNLLANAEKIYSVLSEVYDLLAVGGQTGISVVDGLRRAVSRIEQITDLSGKYAAILSEFENTAYRLEDIILEIRRHVENIEFNPGELDQVERRIDSIQSLKRKYGETIPKILEYCRNARIELEEILENEEVVARLEEETRTLKKDIFECASRLNEARKRAAEELEKKVSAELEDLEMKGAEFKVNIEMHITSPDDIKTVPPGNGYNTIEFLVSVNEGEPLRPLSKTASGGEMSRIMLAIKKILADVDEVPILIFDEIDIGIGGQTANKVGEKLKFISAGHQVICVTHLAQIACRAHAHYFIEKTTAGGRTRTNVRQLKGDEITREIARIMGGTQGSELSLRYAKEMLERSKKQ
jgi:DNA repair protein RecN (Recombination protein N)